MKQRSLVPVWVSLLTVTAVVTVYGVLRPPFAVLRRGPYLPVSVQQADLGSGAGVPSDFGRKRFGFTDSSKPSYLFLRGPAPEVPPSQVGLEQDPVKAVKVYAGVGGPWAQVDLWGGFRQAGQIAATLPRQYPPGAELLVRVASPGGETLAKIRNLAPTQPLFDIDREIAEAPVFEGRVRAAAYRPTTKADAREPAVGVGVSFDVPFGGGTAWRLEKYCVERPFGDPGTTPSFSATVGYELADAGSHMLEISEPFCDTYPAVRVRGDLVKQQVREEWLDFGEVPVRAVDGLTYAMPRAGVVRTMSDGTRVVLHPVTVPPTPKGVVVRPEPQALHLALEVSPPAGAKIDFRAAGSPSHVSAAPYALDRPNLTLALDRGPAAGKPLRIAVRKILSEEPRSFTLILKVRPVRFAAYGPMSRPGEVFFNGKPEHAALIR